MLTIGAVLCALHQIMQDENALCHSVFIKTKAPFRGLGVVLIPDYLLVLYLLSPKPLVEQVGHIRAARAEHRSRQHVGGVMHAEVHARIAHGTRPCVARHGHIPLRVLQRQGRGGGKGEGRVPGRHGGRPLRVRHLEHARITVVRPLAPHCVLQPHGQGRVHRQTCPHVDGILQQRIVAPGESHRTHHHRHRHHGRVGGAGQHRGIAPHERRRPRVDALQQVYVGILGTNRPENARKQNNYRNFAHDFANIRHFAERRKGSLPKPLPRRECGNGSSASICAICEKQKI